MNGHRLRRIAGTKLYFDVQPLFVPVFFDVLLGQGGGVNAVAAVHMDGTCRLGIARDGADVGDAALSAVAVGRLAL